MKNRPTIIGIDLGTTYSAVATIGDHGEPEIVPNREGDRITPSAVLFDGDSPLVGNMAKRSAIAAPLSLCQFVKRQMGEPDWRFIATDDSEYTAEEVSAVILKRLREDAEEALGGTIEGAVVTVPAYFNDAQRKATRDAAELAGLRVLRILNEPTAAALAYGCRPGTKEETILVYDLGGGTFDVTIMKSKADGLDVVATHGDRNLGGFDWDNALMNLLAERFEEESGKSYPDDPASQQDLRDKAEIAKKTLTNRDSTKAFFSGGGSNQAIEITRQEFEAATRSLLTRTADILEMTLEDAKLHWPQIDKILLVGGSTRMLMVPGLIEKLADKKPSAEMHADEVVALGAAIRASIEHRSAEGSAAGTKGENAIRRISDVVSHSLGVVCLNEEETRKVNSIIIPRNTSVPASRADTYHTVSDNQGQIRVQITEGEEEDLEFVRILGEAVVGIPSYPKGAPIEVAIESDEDGLLQIAVRDLTAGSPLHNFEIERNANRNRSEISRMKQQIDALSVN